MTRRSAAVGDNWLLARIRATIDLIEPDARVILFGSRARGDARPDSDWDLLVLLDGPVTESRKRRIRDHLYDLELATNTVISAIVRTKEEWASPRFRQTPLHAEVDRDGIDV